MLYMHALWIQTCDVICTSVSYSLCRKFKNPRRAWMLEMVADMELRVDNISLGGIAYTAYPVSVLSE